MDKHNKNSPTYEEVNPSRRRFLRNTFSFGAGMVLVSLFSQTEEGKATSCCYGNCYSNCYAARGRR